MNFKDLLERDLRTVFLNCGEFAREVVLTYDGNQYRIPALVESADAEARARVTQDDHVEGVAEVQLVLHAALADLKVVPCQGCRLLLDGTRYTVQTVQAEEGEIILTLGRLWV